MKKHYYFTVFLYAFLLLGCQSLAPTPQTAPAPQTSKNEYTYNANTHEYEPIYKKVIKGGLGFDFGVMDTTQLKAKGFREDTYHRYAGDVVTWRNTRDNKDEFFNLSVTLVVSPLSSTVMAIEGHRAYEKRKYHDHFRACMDDYRAIRTQLKIKYPTLVPYKSKIYNLISREGHQTSAYYEGKSKYSKYPDYPDYLGRSIEMKCIKLSPPETASVLAVSYRESSEKKLSDEQKKVFKESSKKSLEKKGLGKDRL